MARELENLAILIDVIADEGAIWSLIGALEMLDAISDTVRRITINVDVRDRELDTLLAKLSAIELMDLSPSIGKGVGNVGELNIDTDAIEGHLADMKVTMKDMSMALKTLTPGSATSFSRRGGGSGIGMFAAENSDDVFKSLNLRMSDMHNILAKIIPLIVVFLGALPAVIGGLVALAAAALSAALALGAIGALAFIGAASTRAGGGMPSAEEFQKMFTEILERVFDAISPLAQRFEHMFDQGLSGVERLFEEINRVAGRQLSMLMDDAQDFGGFLIEYIPAVVREMAVMAQAFSEVFGMIADYLRDANILRGMTDLFADVLPTFAHFINILIELLPTLTRISVGFLQVLNIVIELIAIMGWLIAQLGLSEEQFGAMIAVVLTAISVISILRSTMILTAVNAVIPLIIAIAEYIVVLMSYITGTITATGATWTFAIALSALVVVIGALLAITIIGALLAGVASIASGFLSTSDAIDSATSSLRKFNSLSNSTSGMNPYGPDPIQSGSLKRDSGAGRTVINVDARGNDREETNTQMNRVSWRQKRTTRGI